MNEATRRAAQYLVPEAWRERADRLRHAQEWRETSHAQIEREFAVRVEEVDGEFDELASEAAEIAVDGCPRTTTEALISSMVIELLRHEAMRATNKHGRDQTPRNPDMDERDKLVILVEEVGEVARALTYDEGDGAKLEEELTQLATMAAMWLTARLVARGIPGSRS